MKRTIFLILIFFISLSSAYKIYELHLIIYKNDTVDLKALNVTEGMTSAFPSAGNDNYEFRIMSRDNKMLFNRSFQLEFEAYLFRGPNSTSPGVVPLEQYEDYWRLPYFDDAEKIQLYHEQKKIFEYTVPKEEKGFSICGLATIIMLPILIFTIFRGAKK